MSCQARVPGLLATTAILNNKEKSHLTSGREVGPRDKQESEDELNRPLQLARAAGIARRDAGGANYAEGVTSGGGGCEVGIPEVRVIEKIEDLQSQFVSEALGNLR